ncbi:MAG: hypothetical protein LBH96_02430 [Candidatus Peribacteria bacterium]|jgi:hypothetical protein|nr:hypothetical protein [Candidatus Peribacteria bacterium]
MEREQLNEQNIRINHIKNQSLSGVISSILKRKQKNSTEFYKNLEFDGEKGLLTEIEREMTRTNKTPLTFDLIANE